jgi:adenine phosphoribosyltransferase
MISAPEPFLSEKIKSVIRDIKDFPKKGIIFKDITPVFQDAKLCSEIVAEFVNRIGNTEIDAIAAIESRGFLFGFLMAQKLSIPFIPIRKSGKLPYKTISEEYDLEYGKAKLEMHTDAVKEGWKVLIHDDLLATGGTARATANLITSQKATVAGFAFLIELEFLNGNKNLTPYTDNINSLVKY